jgi:hypothetical protein
VSTRDRVLAARSDLTDYVIHLTRMVAVGDNGRSVDCRFERLQSIIKTGVILPTSALCKTFRGHRVQTMKGPHKAACFTEQPLEQVPATLATFGGVKYKGYGIALHKSDLYSYGGRPVIYGDYSMLCSLREDDKYLWVRYEPSRVSTNDVVDFTSEREWRSRLADTAVLPWGYALMGIPVLLPDDFRRVASRTPAKFWAFTGTCPPDFRIIVRWDTDVKKVRDLIRGLNAGPTEKAYLRVYLAALQRVQVISLEHIERKLEEGDNSYRRIETLPSPDEMPDVVPPNPKPKTWPFLKQK